MKIKPVVLFAAILLCGGVAHSAPIAGAAIDWRYDAENHVVNVTVVNMSDQPITAFVLAATTTTDSTGPSEGGFVRDFLNHVVFLERTKGTERISDKPSSIPVGGSYNEKIVVPSDFKTFSATLEVVAFADKSASATSQEALDDLIDMRKANATGIAKGIELLSASQTPAEAEKKIEDYYKIYSATPHPKVVLDTGELRGMLPGAAMVGNAEALAAYIASKQREEAIWTDNAQLKLQGGAQ